MELKDTVELMNSKLFSDRFKAEYYQTKIRYEKLKAMCNKYEASTMVEEKYLGFKPSCPLELLQEQQRAMGSYLHILEIRAVIEHIEL